MQRGKKLVYMSKKPKMFYYVLLTRCGKCQRRRELEIRQLKAEANARYVVGVACGKIVFPMTGKVTHKAGQPIEISDGVAFMAFCCQLHAELTFVEDRHWSDNCVGFLPFLIHHRFPDGKKVKVRG